MKITDERTLHATPSLDITRETVGIVIGDRDETQSNCLKLYLPRFMSGIDIEETQGRTKEETKTISDDGRIKNTIHTNIGSSSITLRNFLLVPPSLIPGLNPPRYVRGERVRVVFSDQDIRTFTYLPYQIHDVIMRKEDIIRTFVPSKADWEDPLVDKNSYFLELNSRDKFVRLYTSAENGETCPFTFNINTKDGHFSIMDSSDTRIWEWDYKEDHFHFQTENGTDIHMEKAAVSIECDTLNINAHDWINIETSKFKLTSNKADFILDNFFIQNNSYEHNTNTAVQSFDIFNIVSTSFTASSPDLHLDTPAVQQSGITIFPGFVISSCPAPGPVSVYTGGALDGTEAPSASSGGGGASSPPPMVGAGGKGTSSLMMLDCKGGAGRPTAYAEPVIMALQAISTTADAALSLASPHIILKDPSPLSQPVVSSLISLIPAPDIKG